MSERKTSFNGLLLIGITGLAGIGITAAAVPFVLPAFRRICLPFLPATQRQLEFVLQHLKGRKGKLVDLGSGDGRIVIEVARKYGIQAEGIELNPWLVIYSRIKALTGGVATITKFKCQNLWKADLKPYHNVVIFGVDCMMVKLEEKLTSELDTGAWVIACRFPLPSWKPIATTDAGIDSVWVYEKGISEKSKR